MTRLCVSTARETRYGYSAAPTQHRNGKISRRVANNPHVHMHRLVVMTDRRRPRGTRTDPIQVGWMIERSSKGTLDAIAKRAGVSSSAFLEELIGRVAAGLDDRGLPAWWSYPDSSEQELPLKNIA